ncbi:hypothetical protein SAMN00777080_2049 [Aquiflexum balticum DSM 16537]|uniref:Uncharacterized protein n=1 Tax=Aquiflexum balticum DSM 16537 TaxID=758820 RepID=A0A1W2H3D3_9BACT|nr:hypothetical protein [Aquiflexum balticum]SMD43457.1 hypothetical protein SAMN00777080_2049 [Aquiflexum balticum DSM 16537]
MNKIAIILLTFLFSANVGQAQEFKDFQGPEAKNYKPWKHKQKTSVVNVNVNPNEKKGPNFKNSNIWEEDSALKAINKTTTSKESKTGPEVKNRKPWAKN